MSNISMNKLSLVSWYEAFSTRPRSGYIRNIRTVATAKSYLLTLAVKTPLSTQPLTLQ